jgi:hypothetical protein
MRMTLSTHQGAGWQLCEDAALHAIDDPLHLVRRCAGAKGVLWVGSIPNEASLHPRESSASQFYTGRCRRALCTWISSTYMLSAGVAVAPRLCPYDPAGQRAAVMRAQHPLAGLEAGLQRRGDGREQVWQPRCGVVHEPAHRRLERLLDLHMSCMHGGWLLMCEEALLHTR